MGLFKNFISQTKKPTGFLGKVMLNGMNSGHGKMADWGMSNLNIKTVCTHTWQGFKTKAENGVLHNL